MSGVKYDMTQTKYVCVLLHSRWMSFSPCNFFEGSPYICCATLPISWGYFLIEPCGLCFMSYSSIIPIEAVTGGVFKVTLLSLRNYFASINFFYMMLFFVSSEKAWGWLSCPSSIESKRAEPSVSQLTSLSDEMNSQSRSSYICSTCERSKQFSSNLLLFTFLYCVHFYMTKFDEIFLWLKLTFFKTVGSNLDFLWLRILPSLTKLILHLLEIALIIKLFIWNRTKPIVYCMIFVSTTFDCCLFTC